MARLRQFRFAAFAAVCLLASALFACVSPDESAEQHGGGGESRRDAAPTQEPRSIDFYRNTLRQVPLRLMDAEQDLSRSISVREDDAYMTELHYRDDSDVRDLYAIFSNHHIYRLNALDFTLDWTADLEHQPVDPPSAYADRIAFHLEGPRVKTFLREGQPTGQQLINQRFIYETPTSPILATTLGFFFGVAQNFRVYAWLDRNTQGPQWFWQGKKRGARVAAPLFADDNQVYFYSESGHFLSVDARTGDRNWQYPFDDGTQIRLLAPAALKYNMFWFGDVTGSLYVMDKSSRVHFQFPAGEPIVSSPFIQDYYVLFQTPTQMHCIRPAWVDMGEGERVLRPAERGEDVAEPKWSLPLVSDETYRAFRNGRMSREELMASEERRDIRPLMKGNTWMYMLETTPEGRKYIFRVDADSGQPDTERDSETGEEHVRRFDVTAFPFVLANNDPDNRVIYFGTHEGYIFAMRE